VIADGQVQSAELQIYEPPRFFEAFLRGRQYSEVIDITSRICGICPVAYQTSAWLAIEQACGVVVDERITALRRLLYCGEWISSHALHIYLLHAPDFLGYPDAIALAADHRDLVADRDRAAGGEPGVDLPPSLRRGQRDQGLRRLLPREGARRARGTMARHRRGRCRPADAPLPGVGRRR